MINLVYKKCPPLIYFKGDIFYFIRDSISSISIGILIDKFSQPLSVINKSFSSLIPIPSSSIYSPGSFVITQPFSNLESNNHTSCVSRPNE